MNRYRIEDIYVGLTHSFSVTITDEMMEKFLAITGDVNPLHTDREFAKERNFPDRVVYGMLTASLYSTLAGVYIPGERSLLQGVNTTFNKPVFVGDTLTITGEVVYVQNELRQLEIKATIANQNGAKVSKAKIQCGVFG